MDGAMNVLQEKMKRLEERLKARTRGGEARPGYEKNVAMIRAEMALLSSRIELVQEQCNGGN